MKPTLRPEARRIDVRHEPVDPLPLVPAISAPVKRRSGAPRRSSNALVRSVPSFIAKRPCCDMKSSASWYVTAQRSVGYGLDRVEVGVHPDRIRDTQPGGAEKGRVSAVVRSRPASTTIMGRSLITVPTP